MASRLTLQQLRDQIGFAADVTIGNTRYPTAMVDAWVNQAIQAAQLLRVEYGTADEATATVVCVATDAVQPGGYLAREVVTLPTDTLAVRSVYLVQGQQREQLSLLAESDKTEDYLYQTGVPRWFGVLDASQTVAMRLRLWPRVDAAYSLDVSYYAEHPTLTAVGDLWEFGSGSEDMVVALVAMRVLERDGVPEPMQYQALAERYSRAQDALRRLGRRAGNVPTMRNTRDIYRGWRRGVT